MGDAWDDDEFEVAPLAPPEKEVAWDDNEEFEPPPLENHGDAPKLSKEKEEKLAREKQAARDAALEAALDENETEGERRLRERQRDEDADHELSKDLYGQASISGGGAASKVVTVQGLDGYALKDLKGHIALAHDVAEAFEKKKSKSNFQTKCAKELLKKIESALTIEDCDEIIGLMSTTRAALEKAKKQPTAKAKTPAAQKGGKTKAAKAKEAADHAELFGGFVENEYAAYEEDYDDFM